MARIPDDDDDDHDDDDGATVDRWRVYIEERPIMFVLARGRIFGAKAVVSRDTEDNNSAVVTTTAMLMALLLFLVWILVMLLLLLWLFMLFVLLFVFVFKLYGHCLANDGNMYNLPCFQACLHILRYV